MQHVIMAVHQGKAHVASHSSMNSNPIQATENTHRRQPAQADKRKLSQHQQH
jgi:hypothetical protein